MRPVAVWQSCCRWSLNVENSRPKNPLLPRWLQPTAWPLPYASARPYHAGSGSHGQLFRPYLGSSAWHSRRSVTGKNRFFLFFFVFWQSKRRGAMPQGHENKGNERIRQKEKQTRCVTVWLRDAVRKSNSQKWPLLANESSVAQRLEHPIKNTKGRGFESHPGLRFFLCPFMVDSLYLRLFPLQKKNLG